jgi:iron(III) transport system substrate-binding protein
MGSTSLRSSQTHYPPLARRWHGSLARRLRLECVGLDHLVELDGRDKEGATRGLQRQELHAGGRTAFTKKTGIPVDLVNHSTGTLLTRIQAQASDPQWGLLWIDGAAACAALDDQHMLLRNFEPTTGSLTSLGQELVPADKSYIPTAATIAGAIVYNPKVLANPPTNFEQLLEPQYKGKVGMNNPAISGPTYTFVAGLMHQVGGIPQGESFFKKLAANALQVFSTNKVTLTALLQGRIEMAIVQNNAGIEFAEKYPQLKVAYPKDSTLLPSVICIDGKAPKAQVAEAKEFANYVYSAAGQKVMKSVNRCI